MISIKFWGVRGSIPTPGSSTIRYGGNTSCVELRYGKKLFILDAGSGLRLLGNELLKGGSKISASILISHMHWDHIQGIPFFPPAFIPGNQFVFYGAQEPDTGLAQIIAHQMDPTYFPIQMSDMGSKLEFKNINEGRHKIDGVTVDTIYVNHPGFAIGYKLHFGDKSLVYISDNEPFTIPNDAETGEPVVGEDGNQKLIEFIRGSTILIHDSQYTPDEYENHKTWGHSPYSYTVDIALKSGIEHLLLFHHDPLHNDEKIDEILKNAQNIVKQNQSEMLVNAAMEGMKITL